MTVADVVAIIDGDLDCMLARPLMCAPTAEAFEVLLWWLLRLRGRLLQTTEDMRAIERELLRETLGTGPGSVSAGFRLRESYGQDVYIDRAHPKHQTYLNFYTQLARRIGAAQDAAKP